MSHRVQSSRSTLATVALSIAFSFSIGLPSAARGQSVAVAQVSGTITDPTGKADVGAEVTMTETDKQLVRTTASNDVGYPPPNLPSGTYRLEAHAPAFRNSTHYGVAV